MVPFDIIEFGSLSSWVTAGSSVGILGVVLKFLPEWARSKRETRLTDKEIAKELRDELHSKLNECEERHSELINVCRLQGDRISALELGDARKTMALTLLMNELQRIDPSSDIIVRAKAVLELGVKLETPSNSKLDESLDRLRRLP